MASAMPQNSWFYLFFAVAALRAATAKEG